MNKGKGRSLYFWIASSRYAQMHLGRAHCACTRHERSMTENTMQAKWKEKEERIKKLKETSVRRKQEIKNRRMEKMQKRFCKIWWEDVMLLYLHSFFLIPPVLFLIFLVLTLTIYDRHDALKIFEVFHVRHWIFLCLNCKNVLGIFFFLGTGRGNCVSDILGEKKKKFFFSRKIFLWM